MINKTLSTFGAAMIMLALGHQAVAKVSPEEAARLGKDLTVFGAETAGNAKGTIPAYTGGFKKEMIPSTYEGSGDHHPNPFPDDKPLFEITQKNYKEHLEHLTDGQVALIETYPDTFRMPIYKSRRTHSAPQWVIDNTKANAIKAELAESGNGIVNAYGGIAFPIPQNALEVLWNHIVRWRGTYVVRDAADVAVQSNGRYVIVSSHGEADFLYYHKGGSYEQLNNMLFYVMTITKSPPRLAGGATLVHEMLDQAKEPRQAWVYSAGLRRVRRAPNLAFDAPIAESEGLRTIDDTDMYNGSPERYDWTLIGKKEIYIPYNSYELGSDKHKYSDILKTGHINPDLARYELHRVWVVEGKLKEGERHIYSRRRFYIDEDSWGIAVADQYDGRDQLWRVSMSYVKNYYEVPLTWTTLDVFHDLQSKRYHCQVLDNEEPKTQVFSYDFPPAGHFQPAALRRLGKR